MNRLTQEEFQDRVEAVARARRIFIDLTGGNLTNAFTLYQEVLAEKDREVIINSAHEGYRQPTLFDQYERPKCPECGTDMMLAPLAPNPEGYKTMLQCENPQCQVRLYSEQSLMEWIEEMRQEYEAGREQAATGE